jgi:hypothetical protein
MVSGIEREANMIDEMAITLLEKVKDQYPHVAHPAAMRARITMAQELPEEYSYDIKLTEKETGVTREYTVTGHKHRYRVKVLGNNKDILESYPELVNIDSRQAYQVGDIVSVAFVGGETEAVIMGG